MFWQLLSDREHKRYLRDCYITQLPLHELNEVLSVHGLRVCAESRLSERVVAVQLKPDAQPVQRAVFWIEQVPANAPVMVEDDEDDEEDEPEDAQPLPPAAESGR
jgi:hypothetical protein